MDYMAIINKYYPEDNDCKRILVKHSRMVADFALEIVERNPQLALDAQFVEEAAMLHDIGIFLTSAPDIGCRGEAQYICHGFLGAEILRKEGFPISEGILTKEELREAILKCKEEFEKR